MTLIKYNKNEGRGIPTLFESFFGDVFPDFIGTNHMNKGMPAVNHKETDNSYVVEVAIPGIDKKDIEVNLDEGLLTISSENKSSKNKEEDGYTLREFNCSSFSRSFTLPDNADGDNISAKYENGILNLELSKIKVAEKSPKMIEVL